MPFGQAKQYVEKKVAPEIKEQGNILMNVAYVGLLKNFDSHTNKASKYLAHANYPGHNQDKQSYLAQIRKSTDSFLEKKGTYEEFLKYAAKADARSDKLHETIGEKIKQQENEKFKELSKKNISLVREGKFDDAIINMFNLNMHLSPLSRTDKSGNIDESYLRLDKKIEDKVNNLKEQKRLCSQLFVKGNVFETKDAKIYIQGTMKDGKVKYADIKGKSPDQLKDNDYKTISWLTLLRKFPPGKFELKKGGKKIDIKTDPKLAESKAHIAELKMLKQINFFYSGGLDKFAKSPAEKKLLNNALEENLATMGLYFDRNADGTVAPTKVYKMLTQTLKVKKLVGMIQGFQRTRMRMKLEQDVGKIDKEKNPSQHRFLKAEIDFQNGLHLPAYTKFKKFIKDNKGNSDEAVKKQVKHAKGRLRQSSFYVINLAQRYSMACIQEPHGEKQKFHLRDGFRKKVINKLTKVFSQLRESMQSGKAADLEQAYAMLKDKPEGGLDVKVEEFGAKGLTETNFLRKHYSFVKTMITSVTVLTNNYNQEEGLTVLGDRARKDKFRGGARVLYEEQMKRKLVVRRRELMKDPKYRKKERQRLLDLAAGKAKKGSLEEAVTMLGKSLDKKYPNLVRGAKALSDYFSKSKLVVDKKPDKKISNYDNISPFAATAGIMRRAMHEAGGLHKYMKLPLEKKKEFYETAKVEILLGKHENNEHNKNVNAYVKGVMSEEGSMSELTNSIAYKFNDAYDPNNEFFNLSDDGWDFVESLVGEIPIMAASGGVGNVAALGVKQGAKYAAKKLAQRALKQTILRSMTFRLGVRGTAFAADLVVSEAVDRGMRYILRGEDPPMDIAQLLAHSLGTYGSMKYASKGGQRLLKGVAEQGMVGKMASHAISTAAIEAPCMMAINNLFGQAEGTMLEQYGRALGTMLASKGSMSMLHSSTGRVMMKAEQDYDTRDSVNKIQDPWKKRVINEMIKKNEITTDQLSTILNSNLNANQIIKIRSLINNPKSIKFLLAYKYAKSHGVKNQDLTRQYDYLMYQLTGEGLSRDDSRKLLDNLNERSLSVSVSGPTAADLPASRSQIPTAADLPAAKTPTAKPKPSSKSEKLKWGTPVHEVPQVKLDKLATRLKKLGLDRMAGAIAAKSAGIMTGSRNDISTYEQRVAEVEHLESLDSQIKSDTKILRKNNLIKEATELEDYNKTIKYITLDQRLKVSKYLREGVTNLNKLEISFKPENAAQIIDFMSAKSDAGMIFKSTLADLMVAKYFKDSSTIKALNTDIAKILLQEIPDLTRELKGKILQLKNGQLLKPEDQKILEANRANKNMTPELVKAIIAGGQESTLNGVTVRVYKGKKLGAGGLALVHNTWFVRKPSNTIESGAAIKLAQEGSEEYVKYESEVTRRLSKILDKKPSEHVIKSIFESIDMIIFPKIQKGGESKSLREAVQTLSTQELMALFLGSIQGLDHLHQNGITHNDFKPDNIMIGENGAVLIDMGSLVFETDVGTKVVTHKTESGYSGAFFKSGGSEGCICFTLSLHDPKLLGKSIDSRAEGHKGPKLPLNMADKYAVGTSLLTMLAKKEYVSRSRDPKDHTFKINDNVSPNVKKLYELGLKLMDVKNNPFKKDPGYISLQSAIAEIKGILPNLPKNDGVTPAAKAGSAPTGVAGSAPTGVAGSAPTGVAGSAPTGVAGSAPTGVAGSAPTGVAGSAPTGSDTPTKPVK